MATTPLPRNPLDLVAAVRTFVGALDTPAGQAASGLTAAQFADLERAAADVVAAETTRDEADRAYRAALRTADRAHEALEDAFRPLRKQANGHTAMTDELREQAGLGVADEAGSPDLPVVADLVATRRPNGAVFLDWSGPSGGALRYEVFSQRDGEPDAPWTLVGAASATDFTHREARPGEPRHYHVVACRGERRGDPSNTAVA